VTVTFFENEKLRSRIAELEKRTQWQEKRTQ